MFRMTRPLLSLKPLPFLPQLRVGGALCQTGDLRPRVLIPNLSSNLAVVIEGLHILIKWSCLAQFNSINWFQLTLQQMIGAASVGNKSGSDTYRSNEQQRHASMFPPLTLWRQVEKRQKLSPAHELLCHFTLVVT